MQKNLTNSLLQYSLINPYGLAPTGAISKVGFVSNTADCVINIIGLQDGFMGELIALDNTEGIITNLGELLTGAFIFGS